MNDTIKAVAIILIAYAVVTMIPFGLYLLGVGR